MLPFPCTSQRIHAPSLHISQTLATPTRNPKTTSPLAFRSSRLAFAHRPTRNRRHTASHFRSPSPHRLSLLFRSDPLIRHCRNPKIQPPTTSFRAQSHKTPKSETGPARRLCQECNGTGPPIRKQKKIVDGKELRRRTVKRFLEDFGSASESELEVIDNAIRHMYSPDLKSVWGVHVVQEIKLLAKKLDRESLDSAIDELVQFGMQREFAAESICKERCIAVEDGESWAKYMSVSGSPDDEHDIITLQYTEDGLLSVDENRNGHAAAFGDDIAIECLATEFKREIYVDKMRKKLAELLNGETDLDALVDPMPLQTQMDIIDEIMDRRKDKGTRGPPKNIQAFLDIHEELEMTREELRKEQIEAAKKEESKALIQSLADRIKALEDKSDGNAAGENA
ncbi:unnamed protein product [Rhodiola kirilowii]